MVGRSPLPPPVTAFITAHLGSLVHLELLLLLMQARDRWWDASSVGHELGIRAETARRALDHFARRNLLAIRITGDVRYQYQPGEPQIAEAAEGLAEAFRSQPMAVLQLVPHGESRSLRDFADAFRIRRDDDR